jgi:3',5'-cyclic-nucleotide phosphodiesterase
MNLKVLGCHGGESKKHRTTSFLLDDHVAIDAGAITSALSLEEQRRIATVLVSHPHLDHVRDLATIVDNRCQQGGRPLEIVGIPDTIRALREHFFNDRLWPDFSKIPTDHGPTLVFREVEPETTFEVGGLRVTPVRVHHTIDAVGFFVEDETSSIAYSGDTGPTDRFWERASAMKNLSALLLEVSFPDELEALALASKHLTPALAKQELAKLAAHHREVPVFAYHVKPVFERETHRDLATVRSHDLRILALDDVFDF